MKALLEIKTENADIAKRAINPDIANSSNINVLTEADEKILKIELKANTLSNLRGSINTYLRLIKITQTAIRR